MLPDYRRPLLRRDLLAIARAYAEARAELHEMHFRHLCELADLHRELDELRSICLDVVAVLRKQADADVETLKRQLHAVLLRLTRPDGKPLN